MVVDAAMHLVRTKVRSGKSFKHYVRLVQTYRRQDGMPAQKVLANLGEMSDQAFENYKLALAASRQGKSVVLRDAPAWKARVLDNLAYLDVAVVLEMWRSWKLSELLHRLIPERKVAVGAAEVICALTVQRCVAPASKLSATRWFPRTALPELLGVEPSRFHNTRIHRVLEKLDAIEGELQEGLVRRYQQKDGAFSVLFTDVTDAWFEGRGPDLAERGRTKEGLRNRHKVGILLLCNEHGYPLRWKTLAGRTKDPQALRELVGGIEAEPWARDVPIVFDRAMGTAGAVAKLWLSGLRFVTAVHRPEIASYTDAVPSESFVEMGGGEEDETERKRLIAEAGRRAEAAGMERVDELLYVLDLGVGARRLRIVEGEELDEARDIDAEALEAGAYWLHRARLYRRQLDEKVFGTQAEIARHEGVSRARMSQIMMLLRLDERLQQEVLAGSYGIIADRTLRKIVRLRSKAAQRRALEEHAASAQPVDGPRPSRRPRRTSVVEARLRRVLSFNPQMLIDQRAIARRHREEIDAFVRDLNARLRHRSNKATREWVHAQVTSKLAARSLLSIYGVQIDEVTTDGHRHLSVTLEFDEAAWQKRRSTDGFVLLVAHPDLPQTAAELVALYRQKDAVEKDFQTIKSDLELRPIFHHTDPKVRAHVSLCMLALLVERTLERRLHKAKRPVTAPACFEQLASGHLNMVATGPDEPPVYIATEPDAEQRDLLERLRLSHLVEEAEIASRIQPRPAA